MKIVPMKMKTRSLKTRIAIFKPAGCCASLLLFVLALVLPTSYAHQQKTAITRILFNPNSGNIEIMHRFFVHDAEHAASVIFGERQTLVESAESRQLFSSYVMNRFAVEVTLADGSNQELALQYVGEEIDGQFMWVYQEFPQLDNVSAMTIINLALRDVWPDQSNLVNIERGEDIVSLTFDGNDEALHAELGV